MKLRISQKFPLFSQIDRKKCFVFWFVLQTFKALGFIPEQDNEKKIHINSIHEFFYRLHFVNVICREPCTRLLFLLLPLNRVHFRIIDPYSKKCT